MKFTNFTGFKKEKNLISKHYKEGIEKFNKINGSNFQPKLEVQWNTRMRSAAGTANGKQLLIKLNARLLQENPQELIPTFMHELAHILCHLKYGRVKKSHGWQWEKCMRDIDEPVEVFHNMETSHLKAKRRKFYAYCGCSDYVHEIGIRRKNNIEQNKRRYSCKRCRQELKVGKEILK